MNRDNFKYLLKKDSIGLMGIIPAGLVFEKNERGYWNKETKYFFHDYVVEGNPEWFELIPSHSIGNEECDGYPIGTVVYDNWYNHKAEYTKVQDDKWQLSNNSPLFTIMPNEIGEGKRFVIKPLPQRTKRPVLLHPRLDSIEERIAYIEKKLNIEG